MKKTLKILIIICTAVIIIFSVKYFTDVNKYKAAVKNITFSNIDISKISDGTYKGEWNVDFIYAKVNVTVKNGFITDLKLIEHKNDRGTPAEKIVSDILEKQTIEVDDISGATNSSKTIRKAVESALLKGINN